MHAATSIVEIDNQVMGWQKKIIANFSRKRVLSRLRRQFSEYQEVCDDTYFNVCLYAKASGEIRIVIHPVCDLEAARTAFQQDFDGSGSIFTGRWF